MTNDKIQVDQAAALLQDPGIGDRIKTLLADEEGASLVEYALIVALIAVVCIGAVTAVGGAVKGKMNATTVGLGGTASP